MKKNYILGLIILIIIAAIVGTLFLQKQSKQFSNSQNIVGGDSDEHGCKGSAGYSWCEVKNKCLRIWEEPCLVPNNDKCGRENCHGLEIKCGPNPAEICTEIYMLGDKCLKHVNCGIVDGACQQIQNNDFDNCKNCVETCKQQYALDSSMRVFECESQCK